MKNAPISQLTKLGFAFLLMTLGGQSYAAETWTLTSGADVNVGCTPNSTLSGGTIANGSGCKNNFGSADMRIGAYSTAPSATGALAAATIYDWGSAGLGIIKVGGEPNVGGPHAMDNVSGIDGMLFKFDSATNLNSLTIGWNGTDNKTCYLNATSQTSGTETPCVTGSTTQIQYIDSDISVWAWTGSGTPPASADASVVGKDFTAGANSLTTAAAGWTLVGNYANVGQ